MLTRRIIPCLDVKDGRVVKGVRFQGLRDAGDVAERAAAYAAGDADELVILDVSASLEGRAASLEAVRQAAAGLFIPLTVGGGVRTADEIARLLDNGADKVAINTAALEDPDLVDRAAARFGSQCVVLAVDAALAPGMPCALPRWEVFSRSATRPAARDAVAWAREVAARGAGEILLTSIDRDGTQSGYDLELVSAVTGAVSIPVIASGGAGGPDDVVRLFRETGAAAALVASIVHDGEFTITGLKAACAAHGIPVRQGVMR